LTNEEGSTNNRKERIEVYSAIFFSNWKSLYLIEKKGMQRGDESVLLPRINIVMTSKKPRLLCLHGAGSNNDIT